MNLYAFDCDGSIEVAGGPIRVETLDWLVTKGAVVVIVSDSPSCMGLWFKFPHISGGVFGIPWLWDTRTQALVNTKNQYPHCEKYFYISDNPSDSERARQAGYHYIHPSKFYVEVT